MPKTAGRKSASKPRLVVTIDPAREAGVAVFVGGRYVASAPADGSTWVGLMRVLKPMLANYDYIPQVERLAVIEDGFGKGIGAKTLDRRRGLAQAACEACGIHNFEWISPATWICALFGSTKVDTKVESVKYVRAFLNVIPQDHNESDAIAMGAWFVREMR